MYVETQIYDSFKEAINLASFLSDNNDLKLELAHQQMASYTNKWNYGFVSIFLILSRLPIFWIFFPFLYIFKITGFGQLIYKELAIKRKIIPLHCDENSCKL